MIFEKALSFPDTCACLAIYVAVWPTTSMANVILGPLKLSILEKKVFYTIYNFSSWVWLDDWWIDE